MSKSNKVTPSGLSFNRKKKDVEQSSEDAEVKLMSNSDESKIDKEIFPWEKGAGLNKTYMPKDGIKHIPESGVRSNIRCPEWHYEVATWFSKNSGTAPNTTHGVLIHAIGIGLNAMIENLDDDWE